MSGKKAPGLVTQEKALTQYLDSLLMEIPEEIPDEVSEVVVEVATEMVTEVDVLPQVTEVAEAEVSSEVDVQQELGPEELVPAWGESRFKALFFNVGDITLAAPLEKLGGVLTECDDIKVMPGNSARYLGVLVHRGKTIRVIDFENLVAELSGVPVKSSGDEIQQPGRVVLIEGERIGIACRAVAEVEEIDSSAVRWRTGSTKRPWYRGIIVGKMCALLDIDALLSLLGDDSEQE